MEKVDLKLTLKDRFYLKDGEKSFRIGKRTWTKVHESEEARIRVIHSEVMLTLGKGSFHTNTMAYWDSTY